MIFMKYQTEHDIIHKILPLSKPSVRYVWILDQHLFVYNNFHPLVVFSLFRLFLKLSNMWAVKIKREIYDLRF